MSNNLVSISVIETTTGRTHYVHDFFRNTSSHCKAGTVSVHWTQVKHNYTSVMTVKDWELMSRPVELKSDEEIDAMIASWDLD